MRSSWSVSGDENDNVTLKQAAKEAFGKAADKEAQMDVRKIPGKVQLLNLSFQRAVHCLTIIR